MRFTHNFIKRHFYIPAITLSAAALLLAACQTASPTPSATAADPINSPSPSASLPVAMGTSTTTPTRTATATPGPSPTKTALSPLAERSWQAAPVLVEMARIEGNPLNPFQYTPLLVLYGDGRLVQRRCQEDICQYRQTDLTEADLCQLVNAIDRTGFLNLGEDAATLPTEGNAAIRLAVHLDAEQTVVVSDLERWVSDPGWYQRETGCVTCSPAVIDPAVIALYRLLTTYAGEHWTGLETARLAVWLSEPVIVGTPQPWEANLIPLDELVARADCGDGTWQAVTLEGPPAAALADVLASRGAEAPLFEQEGIVWQVQSRWLLPYESPGTCSAAAGLTPPVIYPLVEWFCSPAMGAIPTPTPTITPTPTVTATPIR